MVQRQLPFHYEPFNTVMYLSVAGLNRGNDMACICMAYTSTLQYCNNTKLSPHLLPNTVQQDTAWFPNYVYMTSTVTGFLHMVSTAKYIWFRSSRPFYTVFIAQFTTPSARYMMSMVMHFDCIFLPLPRRSANLPSRG